MLEFIDHLMNLRLEIFIQYCLLYVVVITLIVAIITEIVKLFFWWIKH